jgi:AbrB family looped-hinge helix DNA binding protein
MSTTKEGRIVNLSQKGQATIPKELREKHGIKPGSRVRIRENEQGEIVVEPLPTLQEFRGAGTTSVPGTTILREQRKADEERSQRLERDTE